MKCKHCGTKVEKPEINNDKVNCEECGWIIGRIDRRAVKNVPT